MPVATVSAKGWVVIPQEIRERHGLKKGDKVHIVDYGGAIAIVPALRDPIHDSYGMLKGGPDLLEDLLEFRREEAARE